MRSGSAATAYTGMQEQGKVLWLLQTELLWVCCPVPGARHSFRHIMGHGSQMDQHGWGGVAVVKNTITVNLLLMKTTLFQLPGPRHTLHLRGEASPVPTKTCPAK